MAEELEQKRRSNLFGCSIVTAYSLVVGTCCYIAVGPPQQFYSMEVRGNLAQIATALKVYQSEFDCIPSSASFDREGRPRLSWRVHLLPYFELEGMVELYKEFHLDEPWDSPHNRELISKMPEVYGHPVSKELNEVGKTRYLVPVGANTAFRPGGAMRLEELKDGEQNTALIVEVDEEHAVEWTKPVEYLIDPRNPTRGLNGTRKGGTNVLFADSHVEWLSNDPKIVDWNALFTPAGGDDPWLYDSDRP